MKAILWILAGSKFQEGYYEGYDGNYQDGVSSSSFQPLDDLYGLSPIEFETYVAELYEDRGYHCRLTEASGDHGTDVLAENEAEKVAIQAKRYQPDASVPPSAVRDAHAGMAFYGADRAVAVTTATFSENAREFAQTVEVELINGDELLEMSNPSY